MKYKIIAGDLEMHRIEASSPKAAVKKWVKEMGYDCIEEAARECFCAPDEITAVQLIYLK